MKYLVCFVEEESARIMLENIVPRICAELGLKLNADIKPHYYHFRGKQDFDKNIQKKVQEWLNPNSVFLVMRDQDSGDCKQIKKKLAESIDATGKRNCTLIRIACRELESFYLGDLEAVANGLKFPSIIHEQNKQKLRNPDTIQHTKEFLKKITKNKYSPRAGSRAIAPYLKLDNHNCSNSFQALLAGLRTLLTKEISSQKY